MISLKNIFLFALKTLRLRQVVTIQDQSAMNVESQMSVQLILCCHQSTMYVQQYLMSRLQFFETFVTTELQFHTYKRQQICKKWHTCFALFPWQNHPMACLLLWTRSLSAVYHWWWPSISSGHCFAPAEVACSLFPLETSVATSIIKISMPFFFHDIGVWRLTFLKRVVIKM